MTPPADHLTAAPTSGTPYADLSPDLILDALESVGLVPDGRLLALNSYENRVYQVGIDNEGEPLGAAPLIAKFYRPRRWSDAAILEEHAFARELAAREIPVVAPLELNGTTLHHHAGHRFALFPRRGGRAPELGDPATLEWIGRFLGRIHAVGQVADYQHRPALDIGSFGYDSRDWLLDHDFVPLELRSAWHGAADAALDAVAQAFERAGEVRRLRLHGDCHGGNILWVEEGDAPGPHFVDFDDSRMGPAVQDLWMLLSGDRQEMSRQLADVLAGYEDFCDFDPRELRLVEALRTLRLLHYSAWLARRWDDPAFPAAFPWFNTAHYWQARVGELQQQVLAMAEPALWGA
ncbi:serine/threonine protein kinase [Oryzomicrobium terrae]|uniref:Stress response kinase A n=1 Tax=Oryzomicrobium terrae TaxID=1735038 RepID=A0A5C1EC18_9RHOO|nr:serine/threonine protein kinase [Oryzomicrobium terrae]QEL66264.1 serine/threonine protein kinase [Oryzomicrobium terrae]